MRIDKQLAIFMENKPGALARVCETLGANDVNILALSVSDTVDHAVVRMLVDEPDTAIHLLGQAGMLVVESDVLVLDVANSPGSLGKLAARFAELGINIEYAYASADGDQPNAMFVVRTRDPQKALEALSEN